MKYIVFIFYYLFAAFIVGLSCYIVIELHQSKWWLLLLLLLSRSPEFKIQSKT